MDADFWAHSTAIVDQPASIGAGTKIWHFSHVMAGARIGARCVLGQNSYVGAGAVIGDGCKIQNNVSIYDGVLLEDEVFVGPSVVFTNVVLPRAFIDRKHEYSPTRIGRGASLGANATIVCGCTIGQFALVAAGAVVTADVPDHALVMGIPARVVGWACRCGHRVSPEGEAEDNQWRCPGCGQRYRRSAGLFQPL